MVQLTGALRPSGNVYLPGHPSHQPRHRPQTCVQKPPASPGTRAAAAESLPRAVNNLAIVALIATYATGKKIVDQTAARAAISEVISAE